MHRKVQLIVSGGIRNGADVAKALALGRRRGRDRHRRAGRARRQRPGATRPSTRRSAPPPAPTTTGTRAATRPASPRRTRRWPPGSTRCSAGRRLANYLAVLTLEAQTIARACGKSHVHNLEPEDLVALTVEAAAMAARAAGGHGLDPGQEPVCGSMETALSETWRRRERGIRYFLIAFTDLFGVLRAKLVPAAAIDGWHDDGAGFAGFATWLDMTPADPDMFAMPDPDSLIQLPWKPEVGWLAADPWMDGKRGRAGAAQRAEAPDRQRPRPRASR